jgi:hypothetical protein
VHQAAAVADGLWAHKNIVEAITDVPADPVLRAVQAALCGNGHADAWDNMGSVTPCGDPI